MYFHHTTVEFDLTHPFDPGPVITNALQPQGPSLFHPMIGVSVPQVNAGSQLRVMGSFFPSAQASQLAITWNDTTSGIVVASEVQWGVATNSQPPQQPIDLMIPRHGPYDNGNNFKATGLMPNTRYAFRVRDFDVTNVVASDWSAWAIFTTTASDQVQLVLNDQNNTTLGYATLQGNGPFSTTVTIPSSLQAGTYVLSAVVSGQTLGQTTITIVSSGHAIPPVLQVLDPQTGIPFVQGVAVIGQFPVTVGGANFKPGSVQFFIDSVGGTSLGSTIADPLGAFTNQLTWPLGKIGPHNLVAEDQDSNQATFAVFGEDPPR